MPYELRSARYIAAEALERARSENPDLTVLSAGSLYLAGEVLSAAAPPEAVLDLV